jgi:hypothetical protein
MSNDDNKQDQGTLVVPATFSRYDDGEVIEQGHIKQPGKEYIKLDRWAVPVELDFYLQVHRYMQEGVELLAELGLTKTGERLTVEDFHGKAIWKEYGTENAKIAGRCVSHMVRRGRLPLERDFSKKGKARYIINLKQGGQ